MPVQAVQPECQEGSLLAQEQEGQTCSLPTKVDIPPPPAHFFQITQPTVTSREGLQLPRQLEMYNIRPLNYASGTRLANRMVQSPLPTVSSDYFSNVKGGIPVGGGGSPKPPSEGGSGKGISGPGPTYKQAVSSG